MSDRTDENSVDAEQELGGWPQGKRTKVISSPADCFSIVMVAALIETNDDPDVIKENHANKGTQATETSPKPSQSESRDLFRCASWTI